MPDEHSLVQQEFDRLATEHETSGLSREEKRSISAALHAFIQRTPLPSTIGRASPVPLFCGAWQGGRLLRSIRPFSILPTK